MTFLLAWCLYFNQCFNNLNLSGISAEDLAKALAASAANRAHQRALALKNQRSSEISSQSSALSAGSDSNATAPAGLAPRRPVSSKSHVCLPGSQHYLMSCDEVMLVLWIIIIQHHTLIATGYIVWLPNYALTVDTSRVEWQCF